eukprot:3188374-Prymnesium_polylepis.1
MLIALFTVNVCVRRTGHTHTLSSSQKSNTSTGALLVAEHSDDGALGSKDEAFIHVLVMWLSFVAALCPAAVNHHSSASRELYGTAVRIMPDYAYTRFGSLV